MLNYKSNKVWKYISSFLRIDSSGQNIVLIIANHMQCRLQLRLFLYAVLRFTVKLNSKVNFNPYTLIYKHTKYMYYKLKLNLMIIETKVKDMFGCNSKQISKLVLVENICNVYYQYLILECIWINQFIFNNHTNVISYKTILGKWDKRKFRKRMIWARLFENKTHCLRSFIKALTLFSGDFNVSQTHKPSIVVWP